MELGQSCFIFFFLIDLWNPGIFQEEVWAAALSSRLGQMTWVLFNLSYSMSTLLPEQVRESKAWPYPSHSHGINSFLHNCRLWLVGTSGDCVNKLPQDRNQHWIRLARALSSWILKTSRNRDPMTLFALATQLLEGLPKVNKLTLFDNWREELRAFS